MSYYIYQFGRWSFINGQLWVECLPMAPKTGVQSQVESYQRLKEKVLYATLLKTLYYKVCFKGKVEQSKERNRALSYTLV